MKKFTVENILTWGLTRDEKFGGYKLPVSFRDNQPIVDKIKKIVDKQEITKNPIYGESKTIFFKLFELSKKQREDLLDQDRRKIDFSFVVEDVPYIAESGKKYLRLRVIALKRSDTDESQAPLDEV